MSGGVTSSSGSSAGFENFLDDARLVDWKFEFQDEKWRCDALDIGENSIKKEEENHFYTKENCPSGANFFASISRPIFVDEESIDKNQPGVAWRFHFGDQLFRQKALSVPSCVHIKEMEIHEYHKKNGKYVEKAAIMTKRPAPILKPVDCMAGDECDPCAPPVRMVPPCLPCLPPPPPPSCCIPYPNALTEKEWHNIRKEVGTIEEAYDENESAMYERNVRTCDPCMLPQGHTGRRYKRPEVAMQQEEQPEKAGKCKEDVGECLKRETRGPGIYPYKGYLPTTPLCMPGDVPCGYHFSEKQQHTSCSSGGGGGGEQEKPKLRKPPPPPPGPPKIKCENPPPGYCCPRPCAVYCCSPCGGPC